MPEAGAPDQVLHRLAGGAAVDESIELRELIRRKTIYQRQSPTSHMEHMGSKDFRIDSC
ncbi:hypothetical protein GCM10023170_050650 [Phytohabitans houttuyneae]|uniref:Uncharacterized protein n=1 Tax=Phytohabitans houttuyneae TaxID=1076126 RepID=A0A6V8KS27_9ACTN|nr:hypothetical protein Phou_093310 [Phytohabitans houttuyneae]